jgi:hypothetical protein
MDKRTLLIIIALVLPLVALGFLAQGEKKESPAPGPIAAPGNITKSPAVSAAPSRLPATDGIARPHPPATLEEARIRVRSRLAELERMTPEQWQAEQATKVRGPAAPKNIDEARARLIQRMADLERMNPQEWQAERRKRRGAVGMGAAAPVQRLAEPEATPADAATN